ncbi:30S ribosomal protein S7 [Candidatus Beckwithbacteria bacterium RBG_13_35_6]|uniref:Small ribosomal subunit protein uS7 n=1 Tax=Candidatus Beckwithbacteria bacterium RBG_13_35_6 TaxID=1797456 RepID=A0A1F5DI05_9BACT|nr:MAG: 30S ribosomal protein S7 [Candidatus Beckwithbacteria bacterium RBG_13_35_6]
MSRSGKIKKRPSEADPIYSSRLVAKLINRVMRDGKKQVAATLVYNALDQASKIVKEESPLNTLKVALDNIKPNLEVRSRRVGGAAYQIPVPIKGDRKETLSIRWLILAARARSNKDFKTFKDKLSAELVDAYKNVGGAVKRKMDTHKMADANKAFAHFRW